MKGHVLESNISLHYKIKMEGVESVLFIILGCSVVFVAVLILRPL